MKVSGVYRIRNVVNQKVYIGSATRSICKRWIDHRKHLRAQKHHSRHLQAAWNQYGEDAFVFEIVKTCSADECIVQEQKAIDDARSFDRAFGYNISPTAGNCRGVKASPETLRKMSERMKGNKPSDEARKNMSAAAKGRSKSAEAIEKTASAHRGVPKSESHRMKISRTLKGRKLTAEHAKKSADSRRGKSLSESHKQKLSESGKARPPRSEEWSRRIAAANTGKKQSPEVIAKRVAAWRRTRMQKAGVNDST